MPKAGRFSRAGIAGQLPLVPVARFRTRHGFRLREIGGTGTQLRFRSGKVILQQPVEREQMREIARRNAGDLTEELRLEQDAPQVLAFLVRGKDGKGRLRIRKREPKAPAKGRRRKAADKPAPTGAAEKPAGRRQKRPPRNPAATRRCLTQEGRLRAPFLFTMEHLPRSPCRLVVSHAGSLRATGARMRASVARSEPQPWHGDGEDERQKRAGIWGRGTWQNLRDCRPALKQAAQHPRILFMHFHALRQQIGGRLVIIFSTTLNTSRAVRATAP